MKFSQIIIELFYISLIEAIQYIISQGFIEQ